MDNSIKIVDRDTYQKFYERNSHFSNVHVTPQWGRLKWLLPYIRGKVLEVGPQFGGITKILAILNSVYEVVAIDITDRHIEETKKTLAALGIEGVDVRKCYLEDMPEDEKFDTIVLFEVLEHFLDDVEALKKCHRILEPDGCILISVPDAATPIAYEEDHLRAYTLESLGNVISALGEEIYWMTTIREGPNGWILAHIEKGAKAIPFEYGKIPGRIR
jgi:2-polyprenyl-3-methyl-5-hydroxy-6-metoxy-1,4-benzoquinol methylase